MLDFARAAFDYEPYPVGVIQPVFDAGLYARLAAAYPAKELFEFKPTLGNKYSLSETNHPAQYRRFVDETRDWKRFHDHIKGADFVPRVLNFLAQHHVDLGLRRYRVVSQQPCDSRASLISRFKGRDELSARFEFSMMSADGGHILPHTDSPNKLVTLVFSMMAEGEWQPEWGGGTDIVLPRNRALVYNQVNRSLPFGDVDVLRTCDFTPNQCVIFIKTFNSWHSVAPMRGDGASALRKTLTVNIEART